jgi:hypothetical protein
MQQFFDASLTLALSRGERGLNECFIYFKLDYSVISIINGLSDRTEA